MICYGNDIHEHFSLVTNSKTNVYCHQKHKKNCISQTFRFQFRPKPVQKSISSKRLSTIETATTMYGA